jgi:hypothetical protein
MARKTIRTSYIGEDTDAGPWDEFNDEAKAWWIDYLCRSHAVEVALLSLDDDDRQEIEEAGQEGAETDAETALDRMEAVLAALDEEATAPDDDEEEIGALSPLGAALEALEAMRESATKPVQLIHLGPGAGSPPPFQNQYTSANGRRR